MPRTIVVFYRETSGRVPLLEWLDGLSALVAVKTHQRIRLLETFGFELRRPHAAPLRDKIYELRFRIGTVNYRILYFFHGNAAAVVSHGITKEAEIDSIEIDLAARRRLVFLSNPAAHTFIPEE